MGLGPILPKSCANKITLTKAPNEIFLIIIFILDLLSSLIPQSLLLSSKNGPVSRCLVIIGDVHGMRKSLEALLDKVSFNKYKGDYLILAGDLVNKGPNSPSVVDLAIKLGASAVRGNHNNAILNVAAMEIKAINNSLL
jgi:predicted MPP superfamily phosphohydrolase